MFASLATTQCEKYKGIDRACDLYVNAKISTLGKVDNETEAAWQDYIDLLDVDPIVCNDPSLSIMKRIIGLSENNQRDLEIVLFTKDLTEPCAYPSNFVGFDVAGTDYTSILSTWHFMPEKYARQLNKCGLLDTLEQASEIAQYANSLSPSEVEPEFPFAPVKVYILSK